MSPILPNDPSSARSAWITPTAPRESLHGEQTCSVAVIGGGMSGISAAHRLVELGERPILIEAGTLAGRGTGTNTAIISAACASEKNATRMTESYGQEQTRSLYGHVWSGIARIRRLMEGQENECDLRTDGYLSLYTDSRDVHQEAVTLAGLGVSGTILHGRELREYADSTFYKTAIFFADSSRHFVFNPHTLVHRVARRLESAGVTIFENTPALRIERTGGRLRIETPSGSIRADRVIIAVNPFLLNMSYLPRGIRRAVVPVFQHISRVEFTGRVPIQRCSAFADSASLDYAFGNVHGNTIMVSAGNFEFVLTHEASKVAAAERANRALIESRFPGYDFRICSTWGGRIGGSLARGFLPQTGFIDHHRDIYVAAVGDGLAWATYLGEVAADCILDKGTPPPALELGRNYTWSTRASTLLPQRILEWLAPLVYRLR